MVDKTIDQQPLLIALTGADVPASKTNTDYRIRVGEANGLAMLDSSIKLVLAQLPSHTHLTADITDLGAYTGFDSRYFTEAEITALLAGKANTSHTHIIGDVTGLQAALDGKAAAVHTHIIGDVTGLQAALDGKAATVHTHTTSQITDLAAYTGFDARYYTEAEVNSLLSGKANTSHTHAISDVTGLQASLDSKLDDSQATATGLDILNSANQDEARDAVGIYVQAGDPGAVADGSLWFF